MIIGATTKPEKKKEKKKKNCKISGVFKRTKCLEEMTDFKFTRRSNSSWRKSGQQQQKKKGGESVDINN